MFNLHQALAVNHDHPLGPVCQSTGSCVGTEEADFDFWGEKRTSVYDNYDCSSYADEVEFQSQTGNADGYSTNSLPFWTSPLLPHNNSYSCPSPKSRSQAIKDGRKELMEMIQDMPESSYELSLKDIVDNLKGIVIDEKSLNTKPEEAAQMKQQKKKNCERRGQMPRSKSMDSGVFLLKVFFPISIGLKRKPNAANSSKISRSPIRPYLDGPENDTKKEWWKMRFLVTGESKKTSGRSSSTGSTSSSSRSRYILFCLCCE
ncbi:hypothetical protein U1Q18_040400 [Sarracenia purpurea var. burkii]